MAPPRKDNPRPHVVSFRASDEELHTIDSIAHRTGQTRDGLVRDALRHWMGRESCTE